VCDTRNVLLSPSTVSRLSTFPTTQLKSEGRMIPSVTPDAFPPSRYPYTHREASLSAWFFQWVGILKFIV
jgi:hypothetical protein